MERLVLPAPAPWSSRAHAYDRVFAIALTVIALLHRAAWARHPSDVDPVNFVTALAKWDVTRNAPHPPGYPLFVALGDVAARIEPGVRAYEIVNLLLLLAASSLLYGLLRKRNPEVALTAALLLATHPLLWAATVTSESYGVDAFLGILVLATAVATRRFAALGAFAALYLAYSACAFTRPVSALLLTPLGAVAASLCDRRLNVRRAALAVSAAGLAAVSGYLGTALLSGTVAGYREAVDACMGVAFRETSVLGGAPAGAHVWMVAKMVGWFVLLSLPALLALAFARGRVPAGFRREASWIGGAWVLGPLLFYATVYYLKPTYHLIELPALLVATALGLFVCTRRLPERWRLAPAFALALLQLGFFWLGTEKLPDPLRRLTRGHFARVDAAWEALEPRIQRHATPGTLVIFRRHPELPFRALQLMLPDRVHATLARDETRITFFDPIERVFGKSTEVLPPSIDEVVVVDTVVDAVGSRPVLRRSARGAGGRPVAVVLLALEREPPIEL